MKKLGMITMCLLAMMATSLSVKAQEVTITLMPGWTWISVPITEVQDFETTLGSFTPVAGDMIKSQWGNATYRADGSWRGSISQFYPGYGYKYYSNRNVPVTLTFNAQQHAPQVIVTTAEPTDITTNSATCGGNVASSDGNYVFVILRGICWSTSPNPTFNDNYVEVGNGIGSFTASMTDLAIGTTFYVRAFAVTANGTFYGSEVSFTTQQIPSYTISVSANPTSGGSVTGGGTYQQGQSCTVSATAATGYTFLRWTENGTQVSTNANYTFTVSGNRTLVAQFQVQSFTISVSASPSSGGSVSGGGTYSYGQSCTVTATANTSYAFTNWTEGGSQVSTNANYTFTVTGNRTLVANFTLQASMPTVTTTQVTNITQTTATGGGNVTADGGASVTARGICWSTSHNPTTSGSHANNGTGTGTYTVQMSGLTANTTYYVRAYAINSAGTSYGSEVNFTTQQTITVPTVTTSQVTNIQQTTATGGGNVTNSGGAAVTARGVCWSTSPNPTISNSHTTNGTGTGSFTSSITGLTAGTTYHVRAFATNNAGTAYGADVTFTTLSGGGNAPQGAINGLFSVSASQQVYFSQGNLQYQASTNTWKFAENQYDYIGSTNSNISSTYSGWIDLFGWGTSGYNHGANCYQPWSTSTSYSDYYAYGNYQYNLNDQTGQADWGYNSISNGGNQTNQWRTLTQPEWDYVFNTRATTSGIRYAKANVNNVNGVILLPDDWSTSTYSLNNTNSSGASFSSNTIIASQWSTLEQTGAVFLPAAGYRNGTSVYHVGSWGDYWSASCSNSYYDARPMHFDDSYLSTSSYGNNRCQGFSVRLTRVAE